IACLLAAGVLARRERLAFDSPEFLAGRAVGLVGVVLLWLLLSVETHDYFRVQEDVTQPAVRAALRPEEKVLAEREQKTWQARRQEHPQRSAQMALAIVLRVHRR